MNIGNYWTYWLNRGGKREILGETGPDHLATSDMMAISTYAALPLQDPGGGRPISVGMVWVERSGPQGWVPLVYTSRTGQRPPPSDAPSLYPSWMLPVVLGLGAIIAIHFALGGK